MPSKTYYPQAALNGFGASITNLLGVDVVFRAGKPRTDGHTVYLPPITGALSEAEFRAACGVALHEAAHVAMGSCVHHRRYAKTALRASCFNAVIDVADETRLERRIRHASSLFHESNMDALEKCRRSGNLTAGNPDQVWVILALGIFANRLGWCYVSGVAQQAKRYHEALHVARILRRARTPRRAMKSLLRPKAQYRRLFGLADELVKLLQGAGLDQAQAPAPNFGPVGSGDDPIPIDPNGAGPAQADRLADENAGAQMIQDPGAAAAGGSNGRNGGGRGAGSNGDVDRSSRAMDEALYQAMRPALTGACERLARSLDADALDDGYASGRGISRHLERAMIDGRCFARRNDGDGERLHVAILLDNSGSMMNALPQVSAMAQAFSDSLNGAAQSIHRATFGTYTDPVENFRAVPLGGGTRTDRAVTWADGKLGGSRGRRVMIVITDGDPDDYSATSDACLSASAKGIDIIGVAYCCRPDWLVRSMPKARLLHARNPGELACGLTRIAAMIAA